MEILESVKHMANRMGSKLLVFVALVACGCSGSGCVASGVTRISFDEWHEREFEDIGIRLSLPKDTLLVDTLGVKKWKSDGAGWRTLKFCFHTWASGKPMAEPLYLVHFRFERLDARQYAAFRKGTHSLAYYWIWKDYHTQEYTNAACFAWRDLNRDVVGWRRDYHAENGDVVVAGVEYIPLDFDDQTIASDSNAIVRVLSSFVIDKDRVIQK
jgi:hypothetical protein